MVQLRRCNDGVAERIAWPAFAVAAVTCVLAIAACGSSTKPPAESASSSYSSQITFARCMRSHGVPNFPDPSPPGASLTGNTFGAFALPPGLNLQAPAAQSALKGCRKTLPGGGGGRGGISESTKLRLLKHAQCMRAHGVSNYRDPTIPSHGPIESGPPPGINTDSPVFQRAATACGGG